MKIKAVPAWNDYELIDSGDFQKLEKFGDFVCARPEPQAVWSPTLSEQEWSKLTHVKFVPEGSSSGRWEKSKKGMPDNWQMGYKNGGMNLRFKLALTAFKHVGIFPEQSENWNFIYDQCSRIRGARVLNLFAYTGGASLAARAAGADIVHCDSIKQVVSWARENMEMSGLSDIRWLIEDAFKFVSREANRGNKYNGIILDPPAWGHGPKGERWKLEDQINELMSKVASILDPDKNFLVFNSYSLGFSSLILRNLTQTHFDERLLNGMEFGELCLEERSGRLLPAGVFVRFAN